MRWFRDNRNIYRIWKRCDKRAGLLKYPAFFLSSAAYLIRSGRHAYDYARQIEADGFVTEVNAELYPGVRLFLPGFRKDLIQKLIVRNEDFFECRELRLLREKYLPEGAVLCDCGAHAGNHTVYFGTVCGASRIYAFEPESEAYGILQENIRLNGLEGTAEAFPFALGAQDGRADVVRRDRTNTGRNQIRLTEEGAVRVVRLDDMIGRDERVDLLKIDVEGSEYEVLAGASHILDENGPVIFIETFPDNREKVSGLLREHGYRQELALGDDNYIFVRNDRIGKQQR